MDFGKRYGYVFEHESTYSNFALINKAVYIARYGWSDNPKKIGTWDAVGAQFAHPYVFKMLFSKEPLEFEDYCETKAVQTSMYLDFNEGLGEDHNYVYVGKVGSFIPVIEGVGEGILYRKKDDKYYAVTRTKGYRFMISENLKSVNSFKEIIDMSYYDELISQAISAISDVGDFESLFI